MAESVSILFVCMGNICRSPMAHGVFRRLVDEAGLADRVVLDSAGTIDYHAGEPPDRRAIAAAGGRGVDIADLRARAVRAEDCARFDLLLAMDRGNYNRLQKLCNGAGDVRLFLDFAREPARAGGPRSLQWRTRGVRVRAGPHRGGGGGAARRGAGVD